MFTVGDVNGIGIEVLSRALCDEWLLENVDPVVVGNHRLVREYIAAAHLGSCKELLAAEFVDIDSVAELRIGSVDAAAGRLAHDAIVVATEHVLAGDGHAIVTMPISKEALHAAGCEHTGHTELIASITGGDPLMILMTEGMLVALVTIHIPIAQVARRLTSELVLSRIEQLDRSLRGDFGRELPRIAVLGLNPHAGENGVLGREEIEVISPAVHDARAMEIEVSGPFAADGFFARYDPDRYDGILAMYHDQGLIPLKLYAHGAGVNFTASLPIVRTSPDHGTAFDKAGRNLADFRSVIDATRAAVRIANNRVTMKAMQDAKH